MRLFRDQCVLDGGVAPYRSRSSLPRPTKGTRYLVG